MKRQTNLQRFCKRFMIVAATMPLFATTCVERTADFFLGRDFFDDYFDRRSDSDKLEDILDDIEDLFDDIF